MHGFIMACMIFTVFVTVIATGKREPVINSRQGTAPKKCRARVPP